MESSTVATIPKKGDKPSLLVLKKFPGKDREFNVLERIGENYADFGISLLEDDDGSKVSAFETARLRNPLPICRDIMKAEGKIRLHMLHWWTACEIQT